MDNFFARISQPHIEVPIPTTQKSTQVLPITQLFGSAIKSITRTEMLKLFTTIPDKGLINGDVKHLVFSANSIMPEMILHPSVKVKLFKPRSETTSTISKHKNSNLVFTNSKKEEVKHIPMEELFGMKLNDINDLFTNKEEVRVKHSIEDLFEGNTEGKSNKVEGKINDLFREKIEETKLSPIDDLFNSEVKQSVDSAVESLKDSTKQRSAITQLLDNTSIGTLLPEKHKNEITKQDVRRAWSWSNSSLNPNKSSKQESNKELNPFLEYAGNKVGKEDKIWYYKDLEGNQQGPFSSLEMNQWHNAEYLFENLEIRLKGEDSYKPLSNILHIKHLKLDDIFKETKTEVTNNKFSSLFN